MKKLKLNVANLRATEILTREELKKVLGGTEGSGSGSATCTNDACGALNLPCCSSSDYCSGVSNRDVCVPRPLPR